jgi:hypothetical protein
MRSFVVVFILGFSWVLIQENSWASGAGATAPAVIRGPKTPVQRLQIRFQHEIGLIQLTQKGQVLKTA